MSRVEDIDLYADGNDGAAHTNADEAYETITPTEIARTKAAEGIWETSS